MTYLRALQIEQLAAAYGTLEPPLFDERNLIEVTNEQFCRKTII